MCSVGDTATLLAVRSRIRTSADLGSFAAPRSFSQLVTSFFGAMYLRHPPYALCSLIFLLVYLSSYFQENPKISTRLIAFHSSASFRLYLASIRLRINQLASLSFSLCLFVLSSSFFYAVVNLPFPLQKKGAASFDSLTMIALSLFYVKHFSEKKQKICAFPRNIRSASPPQLYLPPFPLSLFIICPRLHALISASLSAMRASAPSRVGR